MTHRLIFAMLVGLVSPLAAQNGATIVTQATGQVDVAPDHAVLEVGAMFTDQSATLASERLAGTITAILDALTGMGFNRDSIPTTGFSVQPRMDFERNEVAGYDAAGSVEVTIRDLAMTGRVIDAVVGAGGNQIGAPSFRVADQRAARDSAIALAVAAARHDAEVLARAAGGRVGELVELSTGPRSPLGAVRLDEMVVSGRAAQFNALPVTPRAVTVMVSVTATWLFHRN